LILARLANCVSFTRFRVFAFWANKMTTMVLMNRYVEHLSMVYSASNLGLQSGRIAGHWSTLRRAVGLTTGSICNRIHLLCVDVGAIVLPNQSK